MVIKKKAKTFNDYSVEMSWGQLNAIFTALEQDHADPLADELFAELGWYLEEVPGPGEDEDEYKAAKDAEREAISGGDQAGMPDQEGRDTELMGQELPAEGDEGGPGAGGDLEGASPPVEGAPRLGGGKGPGAAERPVSKEADKLLERPPAEAGSSRHGRGR